MVRSVRHCTCCRRKFITDANEPFCNSNCATQYLRLHPSTKITSVYYHRNDNSTHHATTTTTKSPSTTSNGNVRIVLNDKWSQEQRQGGSNVRYQSLSSSSPSNFRVHSQPSDDLCFIINNTTAKPHGDADSKPPATTTTTNDDDKYINRSYHTYEDFRRGDQAGFNRDNAIEIDQQQQQQQREQEQGASDTFDDGGDDSVEGGSEGGDDLFCTQLEYDEATSDDQKYHQHQTHTGHPLVESEQHYQQFQAQSTFAVSTTSTSTTTSSLSSFRNMTTNVEKKNSGGRVNNNSSSSNDDICFVCGKSLKGMKHRVEHIKRCTKKYGISGRDVRQEEDLEIDQGRKDFDVAAKGSTNNTATASGLPTSQVSHGQSRNTLVNPYSPSKKQSEWHGNSKTLLDITSNNNSSGTLSSRYAKSGTMVQSTITNMSTFQPQPRNAINVLLAGARKQSKEDAIFKKRAAAIADEGDTNTMKRGRWGKSSSRGKGRSGNVNHPPMNTPSFKKITGTDFIVDGFFYARPSLTNNYFLTHFHSDHYGGITSHWNSGIIYCSLPTAQLVHEQLGVDKKYLHPLPMMVPTVIETNKNKFNHKPVTVTLLDANHCPGAIMFLFEIPPANGKNNSKSSSKVKRVLHVGDFRWNRSIMLNQAPLRDIVQSPNIVMDELYLDTTYCNPKYELPSQMDAINAIIQIFAKEQNRQNERGKGRTLHLFGSYTIGKEKMYLSVAERFGLRVYVETSRLRVLKALNWPEERMRIFTTCKDEACIWVVPLGKINMKSMNEYFSMANTKPFAMQYDHICGYRPTGWSLSSKPCGAAGPNCVSSRHSDNLTIHSVPYSEHSSFPELVDCIKCLSPTSIIPTVSTSKSEEQVDVLLKALRNRQTTLSFSP